MMKRPGFATDKVINGDDMDMIESPEESPERMPTSKETGGRINHMSQNYGSLSRSMKLDSKNSDIMGAPKVVEI